MKRVQKRERGITLVALVVTIVVLLVLAGVSLNLVIGNNGLIKKAQEAKDRTEKGAAEEQSQISQLVGQVENITSDGFDKSKKVNRPQLTTGMTRVMYNNGKTILDGQTGWNENNWYNYGTTDSEKRWANAQTQDGSMWVWIPRFAYYIDADRKMYVKFLVGTTDKWYDENTGEYKELPENYKVHPSFQNGSSTNYINGEWKEKIQGFWVSKFEAGLPDESTAPKTASVGNLYYPVFQGLKGSYNYVYVSQCFLLSKAISEKGNPYGITNANSHLIKNSEWGAVTYLSYSEYGKTGGTYDETKEVYINNVTYAQGGTTSPKTSIRNQGVYSITGYSRGASVGENILTTSTILSDTVTGDKGESYAWNTANGTQASTTGTIYGVYDMSGGAAEYTSGYIKMKSNASLLNNLKSFGTAFVFEDSEKTRFVGNTPDVMEYPEYSSGGLQTALGNMGRYGDGYRETWNWFGDWCNNDASGPFLTRGGHWRNGSNAGVFAFDDDFGFNNDYIRFPFCAGCPVAL